MARRYSAGVDPLVLRDRFETAGHDARPIGTTTSGAEPAGLRARVTELEAAVTAHHARLDRIDRSLPMRVDHTVRGARVR